MNKFFFSILIICISLFFAGCQKSEMQVLKSLPSEVKFTNIDLTGARSLAVMQTRNGKVVTRSYGNPDYRLCVLDAEGQAKIASLTLKTAGDESNSAWKKIKKSLTLVPEKIVPISDDYLHLDGVMAVHDENLSEITYGAAEYEAISGYLSRLGGGYILRLSDGALFKSPLPNIGMSDSKLEYKRHFQVTPDGKTFVGVHPSMGLDLQNPLYFPVVISDQGSSLKITSNSTDMLGQILNETFVWVPDNEMFVVFNNYATKAGAWSFDMNLKPRFLDYTESLSELIGRYNETRMFTYNGRFYIMESQYVDKAVAGYMNEINIYQLTIHGDKIDCFLDFSSTIDSDFKFSVVPCNSIETDEGVLFLEKYSAYVKFGENPSITVREIPDEFFNYSEFDSDGKVYIPGVELIEAYDAFTGTRTKIPVQWDKTSVGRLVTAELNNTSGDYYTVKGRTREAVEVIALIEKATGLVTITNLTEFGQPIITTSYRLN